MPQCRVMDPYSFERQRALYDDIEVVVVVNGQFIYKRIIVCTQFFFPYILLLSGNHAPYE